jgi:hypothetical protein
VDNVPSSIKVDGGSSVSVVFGHFSSLSFSFCHVLLGILLDGSSGWEEDGRLYIGTDDGHSGVDYHLPLRYSRSFSVTQRNFGEIFVESVVFSRVLVCFLGWAVGLTFRYFYYGSQVTFTNR